MLSLGKTIEKHRIARGLSLQKLGDLCGLSDTTISKIEKGESTKLRWETVCSLTRALNFTEDEFLILAEYKSPNSDSDSGTSKNDDFTPSELLEIEEFKEFIKYRRQLKSSEKEK